MRFDQRIPNQNRNVTPNQLASGPSTVSPNVTGLQNTTVFRYLLRILRNFANRASRPVTTSGDMRRDIYVSYNKPRYGSQLGVQTRKIEIRPNFN